CGKRAGRSADVPNLVFAKGNAEPKCIVKGSNPPQLLLSRKNIYGMAFKANVIESIKKARNCGLFCDNIYIVSDKWRTREDSNL
ncbi:MAG TPA: hypothetical protein PKW29_11000, partial [Clostridia bacterium]|nr:hypothetical protein [Clostridia bacterium]